MTRGELQAPQDAWGGGGLEALTSSIRGCDSRKGVISGRNLSRFDANVISFGGYFFKVRNDLLTSPYKADRRRKYREPPHPVAQKIGTWAARLSDIKAAPSSISSVWGVRPSFLAQFIFDK